MMFTKKKAVCKKCPFFNQPFVKPEGELDAPIVFLGDSPWKTEVDQHRPMIGPAGEIFNMLLEENHFRRREVYITNGILCKPPELGKEYPEVLALCTEHFLKPQLEKIQPKLIVPMGNAALKAVGLNGGGITKARGFLKEITWYDKQYNIIPTYHPSFILRNPAYLKLGNMDFGIIKNYMDYGEVPTVNKDVQYAWVSTQERLDAFFTRAENTKCIAWDLETTSLDAREADVISMNFSLKTHTADILIFFEQYPVKDRLLYNKRVIKKLLQLLINPNKIFYFHNGKFDLRMLHYFFLRNLGRSFDITQVTWEDTMGMAGLLDENIMKSLKELSKLHTDIRYTAEDTRLVQGGNMLKMDHESLIRYGGSDSDATLRLAKKFTKQLKEQGLWTIFKDHDGADMRVADVLFKMELFGAPIDLQELTNLRTLLREKLQQFLQRMYKRVGKEFNPRSPLQLSHILFEDLGFESTKKTDTGKQSTDKEVIENLIEEHPTAKFLRNLQFYRQYDAINKTFVEGFHNLLWDDGRLHPDFSFTSIVSGRIACYRPNLLNIPRDKEFEEGVLLSIRKLFKARPQHKIVYVDSSQIEFKMAAFLSGDQKLIKSIFDEHEDFHDLVAKTFYPRYREWQDEATYLKEQLATSMSSKVRETLAARIATLAIKLKDARTSAKVYNFGRNYGATPLSQASAMGVSVEQVEKFNARIARRYPDFATYLREIPLTAVREGFLRNRFDRVRRFPYTPDDRVQAEQGRKGSNFDSQSSAAYLVRAALVRIAETFVAQGMRSYPFNIVYDSIKTESPDEEVETAIRIMGREMLRPVPELDNRIFSVELGVGATWKDAESRAVKVYSLVDVKKLIIQLKERSLHA